MTDGQTGCGLAVSRVGRSAAATTGAAATGHDARGDFIQLIEIELGGIDLGRLRDVQDHEPGSQPFDVPLYLPLEPNGGALAFEIRWIVARGIGSGDLDSDSFGEKEAGLCKGGPGVFIEAVRVGIVAPGREENLGVCRDELVLAVICECHGTSIRRVVWVPAHRGQPNPRRKDLNVAVADVVDAGSDAAVRA